MKFIITGTHAYGPVSPGSDLDIVVLPKGAEQLMAFLSEHSIPTYRTPGQDEYGDAGGFYFNLGRDAVGLLLEDLEDKYTPGCIQVNIIIAADEFDFEWWKEQTEKMKKLPPIEDREKRIDTFRREE